jgi:hypothetical protein
MKNPKRDLSLVSQIDWARLAAYVDGEGCVHTGMTKHKAPDWQGRKGTEYIKVFIANTNLQLILWLQDTFGGAIQIQTRQSARWKDAYVWTVSCEIAAEILRGCMPYFIIKGEQAKLCLALQATMKRWGVKGVPTEIVEERTRIRDKIHVLNKKGANEGAA